MLVNEPFIQAPLTKKRLERRLVALLKMLHWDYEKLLVIAVVGTNGKGSVAFALSQQLKQVYQRVGLFLSPAFVEHNERVQINNVPISDQNLRLCQSSISSIVN